MTIHESYWRHFLVEIALDLSTQIIFTLVYDPLLSLKTINISFNKHIFYTKYLLHMVYDMIYPVN